MKWMTASPPRLSLAVLGLFAALQPLAAHQPHDPMSAVALSPNFEQDQTMFVATSALTTPLPISEYVPMMSTDGGFTYTVLPGLPNQPMVSIAVSPGYATDGTVFMGGVGGLWMSTNYGASWAAVGGSALASGVQSVVAAPNFVAGGRAFALTTTHAFVTLNHGSTWQFLTTPGPLTSDLTVVAVSPAYSTDGLLLAGSAADGIFRSVNSGKTWTPATAGLTLPAVTAISFSSAYAADHTIFAATQGNGLYVSTNGGTSWAQANSGLTDLSVTAIAFSPDYASDSTLWVSTATAGVFQSTNRAASWSLAGTVPRPLSSQTKVHYVTLVAGAGPSGTTLFTAMFEGLWTSANGGASWTYCDTVPTRIIRQLMVSPNYPADHTVFASTYGGGTLWSTDGGQSWSFRNTGLSNSYTDANAMAPDYASNRTAFIGTTSGLDRISGSNLIWQKMTAFHEATFPRSLGISPGYAQDATIFIGTHTTPPTYPRYVIYEGKKYPSRGLFVSVDRGDNWAPTGIQGDAVDSISVSPNFAADKTLFAGSSLSGLFRSTDGATTFSSLNVVANDSGNLPVVCSPGYATDQTVFTGTSHSGIFKSTDGGNSWSLLPGTGVLAAFSFALSPNFAADQTLFIGTLQKGLLKSTDGGNTLVPITAVPGNFVTAVAISSGYAQDHTVFAASYLGLYKSTDGGSTWIYTGEPSRQEEQREFGDGAFYTIDYQGAWTVTTDGGASSSQLITTSQPGATASITFMGSGAEWIGLKSPTGGSAQVLLDGNVDATVNLHSSSNAEQQRLWVKRGLPCAVHTVTINAAPGSGQVVTLDALDVWQDTCPWALGVRSAVSGPQVR